MYLSLAAPRLDYRGEEPVAVGEGDEKTAVMSDFFFFFFTFCAVTGCKHEREIAHVLVLITIFALSYKNEWKID